MLDPSCIKREPDIASLEDLDLQTENTDGIPSETEEGNTRQSLDYTQGKTTINFVGYCNKVFSKFSKNFYNNLELLLVIKNNFWFTEKLLLVKMV